MIIQKIPIKFILLWWLVATWLVLVPRAMRAEEAASDHVLVPCHISEAQHTTTQTSQPPLNEVPPSLDISVGTVAPAPEAALVTLPPSPTEAPIVAEPTASVTPAAPPFSAGTIRITEIYPSPPTGSSEWVELWNATTQAINLDGWQLKDASGALTALTGTIAAAGYLLVPDPKGNLNNSGDVVTLLDPSSAVIETVTYPSVKRGESYARDGDAWLHTKTPTPLDSNVIATEPLETSAAQREPAQETSPSPEVEAAPTSMLSAAPRATHIASLSIPTIRTTEGRPTALESDLKLKTEEGTKDRKLKTKKTKTKKTHTVHEVSLDEARELEKGSLVLTRGVISVAPGVLGGRTFYLAGSGLQVYLHGIDVPELVAGDVVELTGKLGSVGGETRLVVSKPEALRVIEHREVPTPEIIEIGEIGDATEGWLVLVEGIMTEKLNGRFILEDASGSVPVVIKTNTGVDQRTVGVGDAVRVAGIVSETQSGFRLLPRSQEDITVTALAAITDPPKPQFHISPLTILAGAFASVLVFMIARKQLTNRSAPPPAPAPSS